MVDVILLCLQVLLLCPTKPGFCPTKKWVMILLRENPSLSYLSSRHIIIFIVPSYSTFLSLKVLIKPEKFLMHCKIPFQIGVVFRCLLKEGGRFLRG